ncbi:hypothetical protein HZB93_02135 [Candidatus Falkowbacteria bacterium]|nr:hypothetical protein [Candidatus Falkowbacteria bacterium]
MTKVLGTMVVAILVLGSMTGCPDGDDCASDPALCDPDSDTDTDVGADADADSDTSEDDSDTAEVANCPNVAGDWALTYRESESGMEGHYTLTLEQSGCLVTGWDDGDLEYTGTISESGYISLFGDGYSRDRTLTGNFTQPPSRMEGDWNIEESPPIHGTWWADPR